MLEHLRGMDSANLVMNLVTAAREAGEHSTSDLLELSRQALLERLGAAHKLEPLSQDEYNTLEDDLEKELDYAAHTSYVITGVQGCLQRVEPLRAEHPDWREAYQQTKRLALMSRI
jgi:hypothetical protein